MPVYAEIALKAMERVRNGEVPSKAWADSAGEVCPNSTSCQKKGCPRNTFLALIQENLITGIQSAKQLTRSEKNKKYAVTAVELLRKENGLANDPVKLWKSVAGEGIHHNGQMHVVIALLNNGDIKDSK